MREKMEECKDDIKVEMPFYCAKHQQYQRPGDLKCADPKIYCKFRSGCMIHFLEKEKKQSKP